MSPDGPPDHLAGGAAGGAVPAPGGRPRHPARLAGGGVPASVR